MNLESHLEPLKRYVPLAVWILVICTVTFIPLKVISYGFLPPDDANRHAAKVVSGKAWSEIMVLRDGVIEDHNPGWHALLGVAQSSFDLDTDGLVVLSVASLFILFLVSILPWLRRPESFICVLVLTYVAFGGVIYRLALGRPFIFAMVALVTLLAMWTRIPSDKRNWIFYGATVALFSLTVWIHGSWYLLSLPVAAFFLAGRFRESVSMGLCLAAGIVIGASFTGHPVDFVIGHLGVLTSCFRSDTLQKLLVTEFQPSGGAPVFMVLLLSFLLWRMLRGEDVRDVLRDPIFLMGVLGWVLGFKVVRFWNDWGFPAFILWMVFEIEDVLKREQTSDAPARLAVAGIACAALWFSTTTDLGGRWTTNLHTEYLEADNLELVGWLPDDGGIIYSDSMRTFYNTFYKNPHENWRYVLGFEATFMPEDDHETFRKIQWNRGDPRTFEPWVAKMRPQDRLVYTGAAGAEPKIEGLDWYYAATDTWIGRTPRESEPSNTAEAGTPIGDAGVSLSDT